MVELKVFDIEKMAQTTGITEALIKAKLGIPFADEHKIKSWEEAKKGYDEALFITDKDKQEICLILMISLANTVKKSKETFILVASEWPGYETEIFTGWDKNSKEEFRVANDMKERIRVYQEARSGSETQKDLFRKIIFYSYKVEELAGLLKMTEPGSENERIIFLRMAKNFDYKKG